MRCPRCGAEILPKRDKAPNGMSREEYNRYQRDYKKRRRREKRGEDLDRDQR